MPLPVETDPLGWSPASACRYGRQACQRCRPPSRSRLMRTDDVCGCFFYIKTQTMGIQTARPASVASPAWRKAKMRSTLRRWRSVSWRLSRSASTAESVHPAAASPPRNARAARGVWQNATRLRGRSGTLLFQPDARCSWHHSELSSELARSKLLGQKRGGRRTKSRKL
jgi:hypothetical protein